MSRAVYYQINNYFIRIRNKCPPFICIHIYVREVQLVFRHFSHIAVTQIAVFHLLQEFFRLQTNRLSPVRKVLRRPE